MPLAFIDRVRTLVPMKRGGSVEEVARAILWLLSDEAWLSPAQSSTERFLLHHRCVHRCDRREVAAQEAFATDGGRCHHGPPLLKRRRYAAMLGDYMAIDVRGVCPLLQVFDMPTSIKFYRDVIGFDVVQTSQGDDDFGWVLIRLNNAELMLNTAYEDDERPPSADPALYYYNFPISLKLQYLESPSTM